MREFLGGFLLFVVITAAAQPFHLRETLRWTAVALAKAVRPAIGRRAALKGRATFNSTCRTHETK